MKTLNGGETILHPEKLLSNFLDNRGRLSAFPAKRKMKIIALIYLSSKFEDGKIYTESQVNDIIDGSTVFRDCATVRRELCGNRFLGRKNDCSAYWREQKQPTLCELGISILSDNL